MGASPERGLGGEMVVASTGDEREAEEDAEKNLREGEFEMYRELIEGQRGAAGVLAALIEGVGEEALRRVPGPGKWSVRAILAHMAEDELSSSWRYRQMIEHSGIELMGFDQDLWARLGDYESWTAGEGLAMFRALREANLRMLANLSPQEWQCYGVHAERGRMTVAELARHMAGHDERHILQIRRLLVT